MKKEIFIVILMGVIIGAVIAYGIYTARTAIEEEQTTASLQTQQQPNQETISPHTLEILEPQNNAISDQENIEIIGKTTPNSVIAIIATENEYLTTADQQGDFAIEISLVGGANKIEITSFNQDGEKASDSRTIVYSTADI